MSQRHVLLHRLQDGRLCSYGAQGFSEQADLAVEAEHAGGVPQAIELGRLAEHDVLDLIRGGEEALDHPPGRPLGG